MSVNVIEFPRPRRRQSKDEIGLTVRELESLRKRLREGHEEPGGDNPRYTVKGEKGLTVRTSSHAITIMVQSYERSTGKNTRRPLGRFSVRSDEPITKEAIDDIRDAASSERADARTLTHRQLAEKHALTKAAKQTCADLAELYLASRAFGDLRASTKKDAQNAIKRHFLKRFGDVPPSTITRAAAEAWLNTLTKDHSQNFARQVRAYVGMMFTYLTKHHIKATDSFPETETIPALAPRAVYLSASKLRRLWQAGEILPEMQRDLVRTLILSGQRESMIMKMEWCWISLEERVIRFPASVMKGMAAFDLPMSEPMIAILSRRLKDARNATYVFPAPRSEKPLHSLAKVVARLDCLMSGIEYDGGSSRKNAPFNWQWHDLRRTVTHNLAEAYPDIMTPFHEKLIIAHQLTKKRDAIRNYTAATLPRIKRTLFRNWSKTLATIVLTDCDFTPLSDDNADDPTTLSAIVARDGEAHLRRLCEMIR